MLPQLAYLKGRAVDLLFPRWCVGCGKEGELICCSCRASLVRIKPPLCPRCGLPQPESAICAACASRYSDLEGLRSPFVFEGTIRRAIHDLKYNNVRVLAPDLAHLLYDYFFQDPLPVDIVAPVPLHHRRLRERGYNQSGLIAGDLARFLGLPLDSVSLARLRRTPPQVKTTSLAERLRNVDNAFGIAGDGLRGRRVLLVDDVATTGATIDACASAAKRSGAAAVWGLTLAREI